MKVWFKRKRNFKYEILAIWAIIITALIYFVWGGNTSIYILMAGVLGLYMAINIGANDVANNMGPAVGSKALTITGAIIIAAIFEFSGVMIAGGDVVDTIKKGIIDPALITGNESVSESMQFIAIMLATLAGAAIWVNIATILKAPVSTTHSIIGGLIGAGVTATGLEIVDWSKVLQIAASWIISPVMGGVIAVALLLSIRHNIIKQDERGESAKRWVPVYVGLMSAVFSMYLLLKGLKPLLKNDTNLKIIELENPGLSDKINSIPELEKVINSNIHIDKIIEQFPELINILKEHPTLEEMIINNYTIITPTSALFAGIIMGLVVYLSLTYIYKQRSSLFKNSKDSINKLFNIPLIFSVALLSFAHGANDVANAIGPLAAIVDVVQNGVTSGGSVGIPLWIMIIGGLGLVLGLSVFGARLIKTVGGEITKLNQIRAFCVALAAAITVIIASQLGLPVSSTHIALGGIFGVGLFKEYRKRKEGKNKDYIEKGMIKTIALAWVITLPASGIIASLTYLAVVKLS